MTANFKLERKLPSVQISNSHGFTLIEMMVVISIITILPAIVISNFPQIKSQFAVSRAAHRVAQSLREVQDLALSSVPYRGQFGIIKEVSGYGMYIDISGLGNTKYIIYADNNDQGLSNKEYDETDYIVSEVDLASTESGVVIKQINKVYGNKVSINFNPPHPDTTITDLEEGEYSVDIVFAQADDLEKTKTVSINNVGLIEVK